MPPLRGAAAFVLCCVAVAVPTTLRSGLMAFPAASWRTQATAADGPGERQARTVCGGCHALPPPDILPRHAWRDEFVRMMFIRDNRLPPIGPPEKIYPTIQLPADMEEVLPFYTSRAPERLPTPAAWPAAGTSPIAFERRGLRVSSIAGIPAVSTVRIVDLDGDGKLDLLGADMRQGAIFAARPAFGAATLSLLASIPYPARVTADDVDGDGLLDLLIGDMGEFFPADHTKGAVIYLRGSGAKYAPFWLDGWPRVADVQAADFNGDGRKDLAVAAFGWRRTGQIAILENQAAAAAQPSFRTHVVDPRAGALQAMPVDLNRDGRMDFVTVLAQEHETVLAYINKGNDFTFTRELIYAAPHPNWGSSGIQLADVDKDGDPDVLLAHGDTFDDGIVKPYHGIQWLENRGAFPFVARDLAAMPGVHGIRAADLDGDGDLDVVASALLAAGSDVDETGLPALAWLEQTAPGVFARHTIEMGFPRHAALDVGDIDGDGDLDIAAGNFFMARPKSEAWVEVWINQKGGRAR